MARLIFIIIIIIFFFILCKFDRSSSELTYALELELRLELPYESRAQSGCLVSVDLRQLAFEAAAAAAAAAALSRHMVKRRDKVVRERERGHSRASYYENELVSR